MPRRMLRHQLVRSHGAGLRSFSAGQERRRDGRWPHLRERHVALRAVQTTDFMTAHWAELPAPLLAKCRIASSTKYADLIASSTTFQGKPPATIEWGVDNNSLSYRLFDAG